MTLALRGKNALITLGLAAAFAPGVAMAAFVEAPLTNTSQILAPDPGDVLAAVNFRYPSQGDAAGPVHGITYQNVDPLAAATALTDGGTVDVTGAGGESDRSRSQNTAATISGADDGNLESIVNSIGHVGYQETSTITFSNLGVANSPVTVQLTGGDEGSGVENWFGAFTIVANGTTVGTWNAGDDVSSTASVVTFDAVTDAAGDLVLALTNTADPRPGSNGSFAGYGSALVVVPEPSSLALLGLTGVTLLRRRRR